MDGTTLLFVNGELRNPELVIPILEKANFIVAVDGGLKHILNLGYLPDLLLGDLDSVDEMSLNNLINKNTQIIKYPSVKDETDLELAMQYVADMGYQHIILVGALGGRVDQLLANINLLTNPKWQLLNIEIFDGIEEVRLIREYTEINGFAGDTVSLIPISDVVKGVRTDGLIYPLNDEILYRWKTRGISNVMSSSKAQIWIKSGLLICVHQISSSFNQKI